jgi:hypothetical protein
MQVGQIARAFVVGVVTIGVITALFAPGRTTVAGINAIFKGSTGLLHTAEKG